MSLPWNKFIQLHIGQRAVRGTLRRAWAPAKALNQSRCAIAASAINPADSAYDRSGADRVAGTLRATARVSRRARLDQPRWRPA